MRLMMLLSVCTFKTSDVFSAFDPSEWYQSQTKKVFTLTQSWNISKWANPNSGPGLAGPAQEFVGLSC